MITSPMLHCQCIHPCDFTMYAIHHHIDNGHLYTNQIYVRAITKKPSSIILFRTFFTAGSSILPEPQHESQTDSLGFSLFPPPHTCHQISNVYRGKELSVIPMTDTLHEHISQDIAKSFRIFRHPIKHLNKKFHFIWLISFFHSTVILCQHPDRQIVKTNILKTPKGFFISPTESKLFIKFHYLLWYHTILISLFTTFYIPCAIDFIKSRFYLRAIFTVLLKTKLFCPKSKSKPSVLSIVTET